jgi:hypothetical protein
MAYIGNVLKTCSNLTQIIFSFERYIKVSANKGKGSKFLEFIKSKKRLCFFVLLLFCAIINSVNLFRYQHDLNPHYLIFPVPDELFYNSKFVYSYLNIAYIVINNFFVIIIQFILNYMLFWFIKTSIDKKGKLGSVLSEKNKKNADNAQRRNTLMILVSGISLLLMHLPDFIISIYLANLFNKILPNSFEVNLFYHSSHFYFDLASLLYFIYYSFNFFYFMMFDLNYRKEFCSLFSKKKV